MSKSIHGITYNRVPGYPRENLSSDRITVTDMLQCAWEDRIELAKLLLGYQIDDVWYYPQEYNSYTTVPLNGLYVTDVSIAPVVGVKNSSHPLGEYTLAQLTITYSALPYELPEGGETTYITESLEPAAEFLTLGSKGLYWGTGANKVALEANEAPAKIVRLVDWVYTLHQINYIPDWVWTHPGCVNDSNVTSRRLNKTFPAETLLCGNPILSREITSEGAKSWALTVRMTYRATTWNKWPRPGATGGSLSFENIYDENGTVKKFYDLVDFGDIVL